MGRTSKTKKSANAGTSFDEFLRENWIYEVVQATAMKRIFVMQLARAMKNRNLTKVEIARRTPTSRAQLERLFDPDSGNVTIATLCRVAALVGREIRLELV